MHREIQEPVKEFSYSVDVARAIIVHGDRALLLSTNPDSPLIPSRLELPGGNVDDEESPLEAIEREIQEETGLEGVAPRLIHKEKVEEIVRRGGYSATVAKTYHFFGCRLLTYSDIMIGKEHKGCVWSKQEALKELVEHEVYRRALAKISLENI